MRRKKSISVLNLLTAGLCRGASAYLPILVVALLASCAGLKKSTTTTPPPPQDTTKKDKTDAVKAIDSASAAIEGTISDVNKGIEDVNSTIDNTVSDVTDFLGGFIPGIGKRKDSIMVVPPKPDKGPAVTLDPPTSGGFISTPIERNVTFDSLGNAVISDDFLGSPTSIPLTLTLDDYLASRMEYNLSDGLNDVAANKPVDFSQNSSTSGGSTDQNAGGGEGFLSDYNSISIPIPPSIVPTIFGKPSINLRVNGDVAIHLAYRDNKFLATSGALFSGSETGLDFRQEVNMSLSGSVGDKIKINTDFASLRQFSFENLFKLSYQGFPDEIIQSIEAGNVSLTTPSKYIGIQSALFGFKMVNRFGPMYLTAVAAQKKGERQTKQFGGGAGSGTGQDYVIQPANYRRNSFFLDTAFIPIYEQYYSTIPPNTSFPDVITNGTVQVWRSVPITVVNRTKVFAWYTLPPTTPGVDYPSTYRPDPVPNNTPRDVFTPSYMELLDTAQYRVDYKTGVLTLYQEPSDQQIIAVSYKTPSGQIGEQTAGKDNYVLKLIKPEEIFQNPQYTPWKNILKNTYYVGATNIDETGFSARILYTFPTGQIYEYVRAAEGQDRTISVTGLDRYNNSSPGIRAPDGAVDMIPSNTILDRRNGTLTFPFLEPFGQRILNYHNEQFRKNRDYKRDSTFYFPELYTNSQEYLRINLTKNSNISINVKYAGGTSSSLQLNAFNIVEGSVRVTAGGRQLQEGVDYRVDINSGTVTLLRPDIASLGPISVDYDQHDFFTTNTKTLLGLRAELPILNRGGIGFSLMSYSMGVQSLKTRQGEEPFWNWVVGADATYSVPTNSLTNMLNALPFFNLKDKSEITAKLDFALSLPNPNTQTSPMPVDNKKSIAYVDDFESGKTNTPLGMTYGRWVHATQPDSVLKYITLEKDQINKRKSKMWWYEQAVQTVLITDIKPNRSTSRPNETAQVLDVIYDPANFSAIYNPNPASLAEASLEDRWAGMMQWNPGLNVIANNTEAIEFWVYTNNQTTGFIHFDMGRISEDVIPDGVRESEDKNNNGRYDPGEDVGLDTIINQTEQDSIQGATNPNDPNNDGYSYNRETDPNNYDNINGTEGNQNDRAAGFKPDNEDLDGNSSLDLDNSYFEYDIPLDPNNNPYIVGKSPKGWVQYRVPINEFTRTVGNPSRTFSNIEYYRIWLTGFNSRVHLQFHEINLVGSQWSKVKPLDSVGLAYTDTASGFEVNYVNIEENAGSPAFYEPPPGAERDRIAGQSVLVYGNEQSINLSVSCLPPGQQRSAVRVFPAPNDLFNYRSIAVWAHGDSAAKEAIGSYQDTFNTIWVTFRIGSDRYNFYEYRRPLVRGWQNMVMDFGTLSSLKATKLKYEDIVTQPAMDGVFGSTYRVVGSPTVTNAPYIALGLENQTVNDCLKTDVWFDELRLLEGNDQIDYAMNGLVQAKLAEFGTVSATFLNERADFHRIDERFSLTRSRNYGWALTGEFGMQKVLPSWLERGTIFPLTLSHSESIITPKYIPNTDIEIEAAAESIQRSADAGLIPQAVAQQKIDSIRVTNETLTVRNSIAATGVKFTFPGSFFMLPLFVNQLKYGFGYGEEFNRSYQYEYNRSWAWTASIFYELNNIPKANVPLLKWIPAETFSVGRYSNYSINFLPMRFSTGLSMTRGRKHWIDRVSTLQYPVNADATDSMLVQQSRQPTINRAFTADRGLGFTWKLTENGILSPQIDFNLQVTSNMGYLETTPDPNADGNYYDSVRFYQRQFSDMLGDIFFTNGAIAKLGEDYLTVQRFKLSTSPRLPWLFWIDRYLRPIFTYNVDYRWINSQTGLQNAKTGSWSNVISTGVEINLRPLGLDIFGNDQAPKRPGGAVATTDPNTPTDGSFDGGDTRVAGRPRVRRIGDAGVTNTPMMLDTMMGGSSQPSTELDTGRSKKSEIGTGGERTDYSMSDTVLTPKAPAESTPSVVRVPETETDFGDIAEAVVHKPFFDWNGTRFNFTQTNYSLNGALQGSGSGITNFFTGNIFRNENDANGPSQAYQLGLISDPHGRLLFKFKPQFPFIYFEVRHGDRAASPSQRSIDITDVFTQKNTFDLSTSRPLWPGAQISLNWKTEFTYDERNSLRIDQFGKITELSVTKIGDVNRTFLSIPTLPFLSIRQSGIIKVGEKWEEKSSAAGYTTNGARDSMPQALRNDLQAQSFLEGFETLPLFSGALREFLPRLNYSFSWSGLEKLPFFGFVDRVSLRHAYSGNYRRTHRLDPNETDELTTLQTVTYGFRPLVAFDMNWDKILGGRMTGTLNYDTQTEWAADYSSNRITRRFSSTFGININYQKEGLKIPFFNLNLKNTFGASLLVSQTVASDIFYQFNTITSNPDGTGNGGITKITIEPRFSYDLSQKLTIEGFYRYERTIPATTGLLIPPTRLILAGFDIRLKIF